MLKTIKLSNISGLEIENSNDEVIRFNVSDGNNNMKIVKKSEKLKD